MTILRRTGHALVSACRFLWGHRPSARLLLATLSVLVVLSLIVGLGFGLQAPLSGRTATKITILLCGAAIFLTIGSAYAVNTAVLDLFRLRIATQFGRVVDQADWLAAYRQFDAALYRFFGKFCISGFVVLVALLRNDTVRIWVMQFPLLFLMPVVAGMYLFTVIDFSGFLYRRELHAPMRSVATMAEEALATARGHDERLRAIEGLLGKRVLTATEAAPEPRKEQ